MKNETRWCFSLDGENYLSGTYANPKDALISAMTEAKKEFDNGRDIQKFYVAKAIQKQACDFFPDANDVINHMANVAYDDFGDHSSNFPNTTPEAEKELEKELAELLERWCEKHKIAPSFYSVHDPKEHSFSQTNSSPEHYILKDK